MGFPVTSRLAVASSLKTADSNATTHLTAVDYNWISK